MDAIASVGSATTALSTTPVAPDPSASTTIVSSSETTSLAVKSVAIGEGSGLAGVSGKEGEDALKLLVALMLLEAIFGGDKSKAGKLGGMLALSMLSQAATTSISVVDSSTSTMISQQSASSAYGGGPTAGSVSLMG